MIEKFVYWLRQVLGYRRLFLDRDIYLGIRQPDEYERWCFAPQLAKGTYHQFLRTGEYTYTGYGVDA